MISVIIHPGSGLEMYSLQLSNALSEYCRVAFVVDQKRFENLTPTIKDAVEIIKFKRPRKRDILGIFEIIKLATNIRKFKPDLFHIQEDGIWESLLLRFVKGIPIINTVHDPIRHIDQRNFLTNWTMKDTIRLSSGFVVHGDSLKKIIKEKYSIKNENILVHPHGVFDYYKKFIKNHPQKRDKTILFFGELRRNKGLNILTSAFYKIKDKRKDWRIVVAGRYIKKIKIPFIKELGEQFEWIDKFIKDKQVASLFSKAGIVVLPYLHGSASGVLCIASAFGCSVISSRFGNINEILTHNTNALLIKPGDSDSLASALLNLTEDGELRDRLGKNLRNTAKEQWGWDKIAKNTVSFYKQFI